MRKILIATLCLAMVALCGCTGGTDSSKPSTPSSESNSNTSASITAAPSSEAPTTDYADAAASEDIAAFSKLVVKLVKDYKAGAIEVSDTFAAMPDDFKFPDSIEPLTFGMNEMGTITTTIKAADGKYDMEIGIDNSTFDGAKPEDSPFVRSVFFNKLQ